MPNSLATFMWRRPQNNVVLVATTHKRPGRGSDGTSTRVVACIINKLWAKISQKRLLYNVRDPPEIGGGSSENWKESTVTLRTQIVFKFERNIIKNYPPRILTEEEFLYIKLACLCLLIIFSIMSVIWIIEA